MYILHVCAITLFIFHTTHYDVIYIVTWLCLPFERRETYCFSLNAAICTTISYTLWVEWYYLKNNYLTLRSNVKVPWRSLWYVTHRLMVMHPHTKYHWPISKDKNVMARTRKVLFGWYQNKNKIFAGGEILINIKIIIISRCCQFFKIWLW
jgi:hypothetical protein